VPQAKPLISHAGVWEIDLAQRELRIRGEAVTIGSRAFEIIELLARSSALGWLVLARHPAILLS
jgi:DNA-binding response OmpR family regulator